MRYCVAAHLHQALMVMSRWIKDLAPGQSMNHLILHRVKYSGYELINLGGSQIQVVHLPNMAPS